MGVIMQKERIFLGNLPRNVTKSKIYDIFKQYGTIKNVVLHDDKLGKSKYGFVIFRNAEDAKKAIRATEDDQIFIDDKKIYVSAAYCITKTHAKGPLYKKSLSLAHKNGINRKLKRKNEEEEETQRKYIKVDYSILPQVYVVLSRIKLMDLAGLTGSTTPGPDFNTVKSAPTPVRKSTVVKSSITENLNCTADCQPDFMTNKSAKCIFHHSVKRINSRRNATTHNSSLSIKHSSPLLKASATSPSKASVSAPLKISSSTSAKASISASARAPVSASARASVSASARAFVSQLPKSSVSLPSSTSLSSHMKASILQPIKASASLSSNASFPLPLKASASKASVSPPLKPPVLPLKPSVSVPSKTSLSTPMKSPVSPFKYSSISPSAKPPATVFVQPSAKLSVPAPANPAVLLPVKASISSSVKTRVSPHMKSSVSPAAKAPVLLVKSYIPTPSSTASESTLGKASTLQFLKAPFSQHFKTSVSSSVKPYLTPCVKNYNIKVSKEKSSKQSTQKYESNFKTVTVSGQNKINSVSAVSKRKQEIKNISNKLKHNIQRKTNSTELGESNRDCVSKLQNKNETLSDKKDNKNTDLSSITSSTNMQNSIHTTKFLAMGETLNDEARKENIDLILTMSTSLNSQNCDANSYKNYKKNSTCLRKKVRFLPEVKVISYTSSENIVQNSQTCIKSSFYINHKHEGVIREHCTTCFTAKKDYESCGIVRQTQSVPSSSEVQTEEVSSTEAQLLTVPSDTDVQTEEVVSNIEAQTQIVSSDIYAKTHPEMNFLCPQITNYNNQSGNSNGRTLAGMLLSRFGESHPPVYYTNIVRENIDFVLAAGYIPKNAATRAPFLK